MKPITAVLLLLLTCQTGWSQVLPGTVNLEWDDEDLSVRLMDGAHRFVERKIEESEPKRARFWARDFSSVEAYIRSVEPNRARLRTILGAVDERQPPAMEQFGDDANPGLVAETSKDRVFQVRWPVLEGVWGCGLLVEPVSTPIGHVVIVPDAGESPERYVFSNDEGSRENYPFAARLAENGFTSAASASPIS